MSRTLEIIEGLGLFALPIDTDLLLKSIVAAQTKGFITTEFRRLVAEVAFGVTLTRTISRPAGRILKYIGFQNVGIDRHDKAVTITLIIDKNNTVYDSIELPRDISVDSVFFPFIFDEITHIFSNQGVAEVQFVEDAQFMSIDESFYDEVLAPIFRGQYNAISEFARRLVR